MSKPVSKPAPFERCRREPAPRSSVNAAIEQTDGHILQHAQPVDEKELLENKAKLCGSKARYLSVGHARGIHTGDAHGARGGPVECAHDVQERALTRT